MPNFHYKTTYMWLLSCGYNYVICEVVNCVLGKKVKNTARNTSEKALCLIERRGGLYKKYLSDRSYENKRIVKKVEKTFKYELWI